jgi:hypothetical protein
MGHVTALPHPSREGLHNGGSGWEVSFVLEWETEGAVACDWDEDGEEVTGMRMVRRWAMSMSKRMGRRKGKEKKSLATKKKLQELSGMRRNKEVRKKKEKKGKGREKSRERKIRKIRERGNGWKK